MPRLLRISTLFRSRRAAQRRSLAARLDPVAAIITAPLAPAQPRPAVPSPRAARFRAPQL